MFGIYGDDGITSEYFYDAFREAYTLANCLCDPMESPIKTQEEFDKCWKDLRDRVNKLVRFGYMRNEEIEPLSRRIVRGESDFLYNL